MVRRKNAELADLAEAGRRVSAYELNMSFSVRPDVWSVSAC